MIFGVDYYPEHWPEARWATDAQLMREAGIEIVRLAEFAWSKLEPIDGVYDWEWLDKAIEILAAEGLSLILGTPTAAPPAWLSRTYPDTLPVNDQGYPRNFGARRHYCPNNPTYQAYTQRIVRAMGKHYAHNAHIIGWQIDNEWGGGKTARCYCEHCQRAFRCWLKKRYGDLETLNAAWGTVFWSQNYTEWGQIGAPILTGAAPNPSHVLDYYRFASDSWVTYQQLQIDMLKTVLPEEQFITTNLMGLFNDMDYYDIAQPLDFVTWDNYPTGHQERWSPVLYGEQERPKYLAFDTGDPAITGMAHDLTRGLHPEPFWIMEQQPGHINWGAYNTGVRPGTVRLWTWHALASGANTIVYFRWRACRYAQEQYHSGLLRHDGSPDVGYGDLLRLQEELETIEAVIKGPVNAEVALLLSYDDLWALQIQPHRQNAGYLSHMFTFYQALQHMGIPVDIVSQTADLGKYKVVIAPTAHLATETLATALEQFAEAGGTVLIGTRSGFKTLSNQTTDQPLPGTLRELIGAQVAGWYALPPGTTYAIASEIPGIDEEATTWIETLIPDEDTQVLVQYIQSINEQANAALTARTVGKGRALYLGWYPTIEQAQAVLDYLTEQAGVKRLADNLPEGLIACSRGDYTVLLNFTDKALSAKVKGEEITVEARDVKVIPG